MSNNNRALTELARQIQSSEGLKYTEALRKAEWATLVQQNPEYTSPSGSLNGLAKDYISFITELNPFKYKASESYSIDRLYTWALSGGIGSEPIDLIAQNHEGSLDHLGACGFFRVEQDEETGEVFDFVNGNYFGSVKQALGNNKYKMNIGDPVFLTSDNRISDSNVFLFAVNGDYFTYEDYMLDLRGIVTREEKIKLASEFVNELVKAIS